MAGASAAAEQWVSECASVTHPDRVIWCDGSPEESDRLIAQMLHDGVALELNRWVFPNSFLHRSRPFDVARTEDATYVCTPDQSQAGRTNNWLAPQEAKSRAGELFRDVMRQKTMYVVPYLMGTPNSPFAQVGIEVTDSPYVVANMRILTRMGQVALDALKRNGGDFSPGLHATGGLSPEHRLVLHFPEEKLVWSIGSEYGVNALLSKKSLSLRLASWMGWKQGWLAEHMMILGLEDPSGKVTYMAGAFPSACGKTNLAMLVSPLADQGWKVWTVSEDIAWLRVGEDGRLWAVNPENGIFGVAPGTNASTNPNAMAALSHNTIFTNVGLTPEGLPWWEGIDPNQGTPPAGTVNWLGSAWQRGERVAHPNSRFTAPMSQCPSISPRWEEAGGVPISAIIFGGRRARVTPLVYQARSWQHGVLIGATLASETTAAAAGKVGIVRRDPMAMLPFCGYNIVDYFDHWLTIGERLTSPPPIFHVNWFRQNSDGELLWPGFGENVRVLVWIHERLHGRGDATQTSIGYVPSLRALNTDGLDMPATSLRALLDVNDDEWLVETEDIGVFLDTLGERVPLALRQEHAEMLYRLG